MGGRLAPHNPKPISITARKVGFSVMNIGDGIFGCPGAGLKANLNQPYFKATVLYMKRAMLAPVDLGFLAC